MPKSDPTTAPPAPWPHPLMAGTLRRAEPRKFDLIATADERAKIAEFLELSELSALRFRGTLSPEGKDKWILQARLTANLAQPCIATLQPVPQRVDQRVQREFLPDGSDLPEDLDMDPDKDDPDIYTDRIDPGLVAIEILALALEPYPRADGTAPVELRATPPGAVELDEQALKPFAGLAALRDKLKEP